MPEKQVTSAKGEGAFYNPSTKAINIPTKTYSFRNSELYKRSIFAHEGGHAWHFQSKYIYTKMHPDFGIMVADVDKEFQSLFKEFRDTLRESFGDIDNWDSPIKKYLDFSPDGVGINQEKMSSFIEKNDISVDDFYVLLGNTDDTLAALTKGQVGRGHAKDYWKQKGTIYMELFAHLNENFWVGNPVFKELYPELYESGLKFMQNLYNL